METANCKAKELKYIAKRNCTYKALFNGKELTRKFCESLPTEVAHTRHIVEGKGGGDEPSFPLPLD